MRFAVGVITFEGESYSVEVEAHNADEAQELKIAEYRYKLTSDEANRSRPVR